MTLPELCIRRPVMTSLLMLSFVVFGLFGYRQLPVSALPRVDFPTISVSASLPGASPDTMASSVAGPLERAFATIPGINMMTSSSALGTTNIVMQFDLDRNIDGAALDVQSNISATLRKLPPQLPAPPSFQKINPADSPVLFIALVSKTLPLSQVDDYAEQVFANQISQISGVAQVLVFGRQKFAVRIAVDPDAAAARGLTLEQVNAAVAAANSSTPVGALLGRRQNVTVDVTGQMVRAADYQNLVVAWHNGAPVRLSEIANVYDSVENKQIAGWSGHDPSIVLAVFRQSDANTVEVVDNVKAKIPYYQSQLPPAVEAQVLNDRSVSIRQSIDDVQLTLGLSISLVVVVIFVFLKSASATLIPALALPVSLIGACAFMYVFGYSIDNISLLAITLSVGFVVDDAIVMLENITRHIESGMRPFDAALKGSKEIAFTILSITFSLVAVFIPVLLMSGVVGRVFHEFAVTITVAILVSGFVSLTLTPMLCARILSAPKHGAAAGLFARLSDSFVDGLLAAYRVSLDFVLRHRFIALLLTFATGYIAVSLYASIPKGFFPEEDTSFLRGITEAQADTSFREMSARQIAVSHLIESDPAVASITSAVGFGGATNRGFLFMRLKDKDKRDSMEVVMNRLRTATATIPGIRTILMPVQNLDFTGGRIARAKYQYSLQSGDIDALYAKAPEMEQAMTQLPGLRDVNSDLQINNPQWRVDIDRDKAAAFGITADAVRTALYDAFGTRQISTIFTEADDYEVILEASDKFQEDPGALGRIRVSTPTGQLVPLDEVATMRRTVGPLQINRQSQQPSVTISFNLAPDMSLGQAIEAIHTVERKVNLPVSIITGFAGNAQLFEQALAGQGALLMAAVLTIYILLGVLYESYIHPITILSGLPSAGIGALLALSWFHLDLSVIAIIGILLLIGIVKKNAIMMVDFALERRREGGMEALAAIREAALIRFRPIIMTTLAALLGALPIALGTGAGSELRQPLGVAIVGGLCVSQLLTLYITPVVYYYLDKIDSALAGRRQTVRKPAAATSEKLAAAAE
ncbi:MAG: efflux RND transporter permease subunit [Roseiarcus sp.]|jgi:HAE1 family hydrophobic/amphiphilic exporter-1|uniref:efflux RND transporter permease subunit n=1 Tax=Roseiarcus sp. TaxID=1969460 RepID=UPI003C295314